MKEQTKQRIQELMEEAVTDGTSAGMSLGIWEKGEEVFFETRGYADIEQEKPMKRDSIFRMYSMTKPITSAAAMILLERGMLDFAQPVSDFFPEYEKLTVDVNGEILPTDKVMTVQNLLDMTSGLTYGDTETLSGRMILKYIGSCIQKMNTENAVSTVELARHLGTVPLAFEPDSSWFYGLSADVLGAVIEIASGMPFGEFLRRNLFEPLGMEDTGFWVPEEKRHRLVKVYESTGKGEVVPYDGNHLVISNKMDKPPAFESGGAGLVSTIDDYHKFAQMLLNMGSLGDVKIMSPATVRFMTSGDLTPDQQKSYRDWVGLHGHTYSHLLRILRNPGQASIVGCKGEYGWDGWLGCYFANIPEKDMTILLMQQRKEGGTITTTRRIRNVLMCE